MKLTETPHLRRSSAISPFTATPLSRYYMAAFSSWVGTGGGNPSAAMYEGASTDGGYAVPTVVAGSVVQLGHPDSALRRLATVINTDADIKFPIVATSGTAAAKPESGASLASFTASSPTFGEFTLSAFMGGVDTTISMEFARDVVGFLAFLSQDTMLDLDTYEENLFLHGSGVNEPQGLLGNTGAGVTAATPDSAGNLLSIAATEDVLPTLKDVYHANASYLMNRATGTALRKAQDPGNRVFTRSNGQDYLNDYPVFYSASMPAIAPGATPVLFGDFRFGYIIGDRGGPGAFIKMLDQMLAVQGLVQFLTYRRTDGRVRRSEAIQAITLHS